MRLDIQLSINLPLVLNIYSYSHKDAREVFKFRGYLILFVFGSHMAIARFQRPCEAR
jgi:hypothetical protein